MKANGISKKVRNWRMKDYLNNSETKEMIILSQSRNLIKHFVEGNVMSKEEKTSLKKASTT